jgi:hypothetical protein
MRRRAQIKAKWHRRKVRKAAGITLPSGRKSKPVPSADEAVPKTEPQPEPVAAEGEAAAAKQPAAPDAPKPDA